MNMHKKKQKNIYYAKILIAISLALLCYGLILDIHNEVRLIDPQKGVKAINDNNGKYTSIDKNNHNNNSNNNNNNNSENSSDNNSQNNSQTEWSQTNNSNLNDENDSIRKSIENKYDISIRYGSETEGYIVGGLSTTVISDSETINKSLNDLNTVLGLYPSGLFKEIKNGGIPLTIYLINSYSEELVTGATDSNYSFANISIAVAYPLDETFFHESYHYIERYIFKRGLTFNDLMWNNYNPPGFTYGSVINDYSYKNTLSENSYFVNNYAQTAAEEDRASTFEYMMAKSKASCLNTNMPVWKKATVMSKTIDGALNTVSPNVVEYWERHL